ncbi:NAD(P)/FAD-dependent oxidoreductase [Microbacterium sp. NPDC078814]|uniref:NAD(P)/FAD-dependent oxidoreductase n=1 Tax=Microbacterium sp. NPDC078814 TaxID=3154767 RepID=UPI00344F6474
MSAHHTVILGAGAAGTAAARTLAGHENITTTLIGHTGETPYTRMLIKGVAYGMTTPEFVRLPMPDVPFLPDTAELIDPDTRKVHLASGATVGYDSLIIATGSRPRTLDAPGVAQATRSGSVINLHALEDAVRIRAAILARGESARIAIYGAGFTAAETASALLAQGHQITLIARSTIPGIAAFGRPVAEHLAAEHHSRVSTFFGRTIREVHSDAAATVLTLDDGTTVRVDLLIVALGTTPAAPSPWPDGVDVDDRLRAQGVPDVFAAGGVAIHHDEELGTWRIDHWDDGAAQGTHAAQMLLHTLGVGEDPGPYLPRSPYMGMIYGQMIAGAGYTGHPETRRADSDEFVVLHGPADTVVGVSGVDAVGTIYQWGQQLHQAVS